MKIAVERYSKQKHIQRDIYNNISDYDITPTYLIINYEHRKIYINHTDIIGFDIEDR